MRVVQALRWLHDVVPSNRRRILDLLLAVLADPGHGPAIRDDLRAGLHTLPTWMQSLVRELLDTLATRSVVHLTTGTCLGACSSQ